MTEPRQKRVLVVLFVPSVERDGATEIDQGTWVDRALETLGTLFGGATAYPRAKGVWRDDDRGGALVMDQVVIVHCYARPEELGDEGKQDALSAFCFECWTRRNRARSS